MAFEMIAHGCPHHWIVVARNAPASIVVECSKCGCSGIVRELSQKECVAAMYAKSRYPWRDTTRVEVLTKSQ